MAPRPITLQPKDPDDLPLGFDMGEHLTGRRQAFRDVDTGERRAGKLLNEALTTFGVAPKVVSVSGYYRPFGAEPETLKAWSQQTKIAGTVDARTLGYIIHGLARRRSERAGKDGTAPEVYVTEVSIDLAPPPKKLPPRDKRGRFKKVKGGKPAKKSTKRKSHAAKSTRTKNKSGRRTGTATRKGMGKPRRTKSKRRRPRN